MKWGRLIVFCVLCLFSCKKESSRSVETSFYHWTTDLATSELELDYLKKLDVKRLYLRFFDVDWQGQEAVSLAPINWKTPLPAGIEIVPTIFITNRTLLKISPEQIPQLSQRIYQKIKDLAAVQPSIHLPEIQLDCDWSGASRIAFFTLTETLKKELAKDSISLSCTIRLHQVQYFEKTGVPPVDRGVLMFYNMGNVDEVDAKETILNLDIARQYLDRFEDYPLDLDVALPLFAWGVLIREDKVLKLINNLRTESLQDTSRFRSLGENRFEVHKSTYLQGYYLYAGDQIRLEEVRQEALVSSVQLLAPLLKKSPLRVIYYHLDSTIITHFHYDTLQHLSDRFH